MTQPVNDHRLHYSLFSDGEDTEYYDILLDIRPRRYDDQLAVVMTPRAAWNLIHRLQSQLEVGDEQIVANFIGKLTESDYATIGPLSNQYHTIVRNPDRKPKTKSKGNKT